MDEGQGEFFQKDTEAVNFKVPRKVLWGLGIIVALGLLSGVIWCFKWHQPALDWYNRASITIKVREGETYTIEGATVTVLGKSGTTDINGKVSIANIVAGNQEFIISKDGYQEKKQILPIKRGDNELQYISLEKNPENAYAVKGFVQDYVGGGPLVDVEVSLGERKTKTDPSGAYLFEKTKPGDNKLILSKVGYTTKELLVKVGNEDLVSAELSLVPVGQVAFASNRNGKRNLYTSAYDGSSQKLFVEPKNEGEDFAPSPSFDGKLIAFSSTRDKIKSTYGDDLTKLYMIGEDGKNLKKISDDLSPAFKVLWAPDSKNFYFSAYTSPKLDQSTYRIYNVAKGSLVDVGEPLYNPVFSPDGGILAYYTTSLETTGDSGEVYTNILKTFNIVNGERKSLVKRDQTFTNIRFSADNKSVAYDTILSGAKHRFQVTLGDQKEVEVPTDTVSSRQLVLSPDKTGQAFTEERDGKRDLFLVDKDGKNEKRLTTVGVVIDQLPIWDASGKYLTFAIKREGETALYIVASSGGEPKKVTDFYLVNQAP